MRLAAPPALPADVAARYDAPLKALGATSVQSRTDLDGTPVVDVTFADANARRIAAGLLEDVVDGARLVLSAPGNAITAAPTADELLAAAAKLPGVHGTQRVLDDLAVLWTDTPEQATSLQPLIRDQVGGLDLEIEFERTNGPLPHTIGGSEG